MECVAYLRVSTEKQAEEGNGLESQKRDIEIYSRKNELIIKDWYVDDGYTGANMNRPALQRLINDCMARKVQCIVAFKLDRISRSMVDGIYIIERIFQPNNVKFYCVHDSVNYDSPMEQAYTQMMAVFAQLDKNTMLLRMRGGMLERIKKGYWQGGGNAPYCYRYDKELGYLIPVPEKAEKARAALELYISGYSDGAIYEMLGFSCETAVKNILTGKVNIGYIPYKGQLYKGLHEPVFDKERFELAQEIRKTRTKKKYLLNARMLTGLCYCGVCGCKMHYKAWVGKHKIVCYSKDKYKSHIPNHNLNCTNTFVYDFEIERQVEKKILQISMNVKKERITERETKMQILEKQLEKEKVKLKRLYELYSEGNDTVISLISEREKDIANLTKQIDIERSNEQNRPNKDLVFDQIKKVADVWSNTDNKGKNKILKSIIEKIVIVNDNVDIYIKKF